MKYARWHSPRFREVFLRLDPEAQKRVAETVFQVQKGEVEGVPNGVTLEIETEAAEVIAYEIKGGTIFLLDLHIVS